MNKHQPPPWGYTASYTGRCVHCRQVATITPRRTGNLCQRCRDRLTAINAEIGLRQYARDHSMTRNPERTPIGFGCGGC